MGKIWQTRLWFSDERGRKEMKTLKEVACGKTVKVKKLTGEGPVKRRIMDMGDHKRSRDFCEKSSAAW